MLVFLLAERQGFEPWVPCGTQTFQVCALDHYATSPCPSLRRNIFNFSYFINRPTTVLRPSILSPLESTKSSYGRAPRIISSPTNSVGAPWTV